MSYVNFYFDIAVFTYVVLITWVCACDEVRFKVTFGVWHLLLLCQAALNKPPQKVYHAVGYGIRIEFIKLIDLCPVSDPAFRNPRRATRRHFFLQSPNI